VCVHVVYSHYGHLLGKTVFKFEHWNLLLKGKAMPMGKARRGDSVLGYVFVGRTVSSLELDLLRNSIYKSWELGIFKCEEGGLKVWKQIGGYLEK